MLLLCLFIQFIQYSEKYLGLLIYARNKAFCIMKLHFKELH